MGLAGFGWVLTLNECSGTLSRVDLLLIQLKAAIRRLLEEKGIRARVLDKVNRYGEVVIGIIFEAPQSPQSPQSPPSPQVPSDAEVKQECEKERDPDPRPATKTSPRST